VFFVLSNLLWISIYRYQDSHYNLTHALFYNQMIMLFIMRGQKDWLLSCFFLWMNCGCYLNFEEKNIRMITTLLKIYACNSNTNRSESRIFTVNFFMQSYPAKLYVGAEFLFANILCRRFPQLLVFLLSI
jgi:hypothetical protein